MEIVPRVLRQKMQRSTFALLASIATATLSIGCSTEDGQVGSVSDPNPNAGGTGGSGGSESFAAGHANGGKPGGGGSGTSGTGGLSMAGSAGAAGFAQSGSAGSGGGAASAGSAGHTNGGGGIGGAGAHGGASGGHALGGMSGTSGAGGGGQAGVGGVPNGGSSGMGGAAAGMTSFGGSGGQPTGGTSGAAGTGEGGAAAGGGGDGGGVSGGSGGMSGSGGIVAAGGAAIGPACDPCPFGQVPDPTTGSCAAICANGGGLQPGAQWPMHGGCPTHRGLSAYVGPSNPQILWQTKVPTDEGLGTEFILGADATVYYPTAIAGLLVIKLYGSASLFTDLDGMMIPALGQDGTVYGGDSMGRLDAYSAAGVPLWNVSSEGGLGSVTVAPDGAVLAASEQSVASINPDGTQRWTFQSGSSFGWDADPTLGTDGTTYVSGDKVYALDAQGKLKWTAPTGPTAIPAISPPGDIYYGNGTHLVGLHPDGTSFLDLTLGPARVTWVSIAGDGTLWASGAYGGGTVWHLTPAGSLLKTIHFPTTNMTAPVIDACGNVYVSSVLLYGISPEGDITSTFADPNPVSDGGCGPPVLVANGTLAVACGEHLYVLAD